MAKRTPRATPAARPARTEARHSVADQYDVQTLVGTGPALQQQRDQVVRRLVDRLGKK